MIEKILERLEEVKTKRFVSGFTNNLYELGACHAMDIAKEIVKEVAKEYGNGWIPCSERLPERPKIGEDSYLVQCEYIVEPYTAYWDGEKWTDIESLEESNIIAWQPLPAPYRKGE